MATANAIRTNGRGGKPAAANGGAIANSKGKGRKATRPTEALPTTPAEAAAQEGACYGRDWPAENVELVRSLRHRLFRFLEEQADVQVMSIDAPYPDSADILFYTSPDNGICHRLTLSING
ncbi:hypothetical protein OJF2_65140 [Aquisphaera giovannonii]|uniref:Uncharacterized protein n=1 Tax=Aquisphaera giovannonii TaxID=406548 RepID=A0A5B9WCG8_9BACT|nr:hypothetical protein [Aquisphaera giovannonii]QEH37919.1 hypothetical protein OJF2_65140 [Aquisphaera giovannonii]